MTREEINATLLDVSDAGRGLVYSEPKKSRKLLEAVIEECRRDHRDLLPHALNCYCCASPASPKRREILLEAIQVSQELGIRQQCILALSNLGTVESELGHKKDSILIWEKALSGLNDIAETTERWSYMQCMLANNLMWGFTELGDATSASKYRTILFKHLPNCGSERQKGYCLGNIAGDFANAGDLDSQATLLKTALQHAANAEDGILSSKLYATQGEVYLLLNQYKEAEEAILSAIRLATDANDLRCLGLVTTSYAKLHIKTSRFIEAEECLQKAQNALGTLADEYFDILICWGQIFHRKEEYEKSREYFLEAEVGFLSKDIKRPLPNLYAQLSASYYLSGDVRKAFDYLTKKNLIQEEVFNTDAKKSLNSIQILLAIAQEKHEAELARIRSQQAEQALRLKERDLANTASSLAAQTELLGNFRTDLRKIVLRPDRVEPEEIIRQVREKLKELPCEMIDFSKFEGQFSTVHPEFRAKLETTYPGLTPQEVKMCMLVQVNLKTPAIARLMCLSERTVDNHRFNIRKKMGLKTEDNLAEHLRKLEGK